MPGDRSRALKYEAASFTVAATANRRMSFVGVDDQPSPLRGWIGGTGTVSFADVTVDLLRIDGRTVFLRVHPS